MPVVGLIGGIAPESTIDYYRRIVAQYRERRGNGEYPRIVVNSINLNTLLEFVSTDRLDELTTYLLGELARLARAGADFGLFASNTPHIVFDRLSPQSPIPLISIVEATAAAARTQGSVGQPLRDTLYNGRRLLHLRLCPLWDHGRAAEC